MESTKITTHSSYRIEKKPGGGFIAIPLEGNGTTVEAPTHEELQQKIREQDLRSVLAEFPSLKVAWKGSPGTSFHIDPKPGGGFVAHSDAPGAEDVEGATKQEVESKLFQKYLGAAGKELLPEISRLLNANGDSSDLKVVIHQNTAASALVDAEQKSVVNWASGGAVGGAQLKPAGSGLASAGNNLDDSPIVPEANNSWKIFAIGFASLGILGLLYFFLH